MNFKRSLIPTAFVAAMTLSASLAFAEEALPLPPVKQSGNVSYVSGGVPDEQLPAINAAKRDYPLVIELYQKAGAKSEYTADAQIRITDRKGTVVLEDTSDGPFFLVRTPPGTYKVQATLNGKSLSQQSVTVPARGSKRIVFVFPQATD